MFDKPTIEFANEKTVDLNIFEAYAILVSV